MKSLAIAQVIVSIAIAAGWMSIGFEYREGMTDRSISAEDVKIIAQR